MLHDDWTADIGGKNVQLAKPYRPKAMASADFVGRERELRMLTAAWMGGRRSLPLSPLLFGEPGVGKNRLVYEIASRTGKDLYIFQGHEDVTAEDLACAVRFSDVDGKTMDYVLSPLVTAMHLGQICFIDEIAKIRPRALALLVSVLDERRYIDSTLLGERVEASAGFRFIAATNTADLEGQSMPEFLRSRLKPIISVGYPPRTEIENIVSSQFSWLTDTVTPLLSAFWSLWERSGVKRPPTARDVIHLFNLSTSIADLEASETGPASTSPAVRPQHLELAFADLFEQTPVLIGHESA